MAAQRRTQPFDGKRREVLLHEDDEMRNTHVDRRAARGQADRRVAVRILRIEEDRLVRHEDVPECERDRVALDASADLAPARLQHDLRIRDQPAGDRVARGATRAVRTEATRARRPRCSSRGGSGRPRPRGRGRRRRRPTGRGGREEPRAGSRRRSSGGRRLEQEKSSPLDLDEPLGGHRIESHSRCLLENLAARGVFGRSVRSRREPHAAGAERARAEPNRLARPSRANVARRTYRPGLPGTAGSRCPPNPRRRRCTDSGAAVARSCR